MEKENNIHSQVREFLQSVEINDSVPSHESSELLLQEETVLFDNSEINSEQNEEDDDNWWNLSVGHLDYP